jgi:hypothetical protein
MKRVANTGQEALFDMGAPGEPAVELPGDGDFINADPYHLHIGGQRLDALLEEKGMGWVVQLQRVLRELDYSLLTTRYSRVGRQAFHPRTMLGLIVLGMQTRQWSLRELENLSAMHLGAWWICGGRQIDHSTIGKFVQMHDEVLTKEFFEDFVKWLARRLGLKAGVASIDGTVIEAAGSRWSALREEAARQIAGEAKRDAARSPEDAKLAQAATQASAVLEEVEKRAAARAKQGKDTKTVAVVATEIEAVIQPRKDGVQRAGYKPSTLMHESGFVLAQCVHASSETASVGPLLEQHGGIFSGGPSTLLLDAAYHNGPLLGFLAEQEIDVLCPSGQAFKQDGDWTKRSAHALVRKREFTYDLETDTYVCPAGQRLRHRGSGKERHGLGYQLYRTDACGSCALRSRCTTSRRGREVKRYVGDEYKEAMDKVLEQPQARRMYKRRLAMAEPVYAELRERQGLRRFRRRGIRGARVEFALHCLALNLRKALHRGVFQALSGHGKRLYAFLALWAGSKPPRAHRDRFSTGLAFPCGVALAN